jgi:hypothetical protein
MAGDWIKMRTSLLTHPKVVRISSALKADRHRTVGGLYSVWCLFDVHSDDGQLAEFTHETLDDIVNFDGISRAMESVGWLISDKNGLRLPEYDTHNGQSSKRRAQDSERKRSVRKVSASEADKLKTKSGPEKRREEKSIKEANASLRGTKKCPASFEVTPNLIDWALESCPLVNTANETPVFRDYTFSRSITDWAGAWRNWMRKAQKDADKRNPNSETAYQKSMRERVAEFSPELAKQSPDYSKTFIQEVQDVIAITGY